MMGERIEVFSMWKWKRILSVLLLLAAVLTCFSPICEAESLDCRAKLLAITFDDGPGPYTAGLLDELAARGVKGFLSAELNAGQMVEDVRLAVNGVAPVEHFGRQGGMMFAPDEALAALKEKLIKK